MRNQVFVPTAPKFADQVPRSWELQEPLVEAGYRPGLMLITFGGREGVTSPKKEAQFKNLEVVRDVYGDSAVVTTPHCLPIEEMDFLHNGDYATEFIQRGIDFARGLPIGGRRILTFHLNSLVTADEFRERNAIDWGNIFHRKIAPRLKAVSAYAGNNGVDVAVETVPVPEFGDLSPDDQKAYRGSKLRDMLNPFYLTRYRGFEEVRDVGLGICLDLCHNRTIYDAAKRGDSDGVLVGVEAVALKVRSLLYDLGGLNSVTDLVHLADGRGSYSKKEKTSFEEGVALGEGDINGLRAMIDHLDREGIPYVLEIDERDYIGRPNTQRSIEYLLK